MTADQKRLAAILGALAGLVLLALLVGRTREELRPEPRGALVAIEVDGSGLARVGRVRLTAGTPFTLHAVLAAEDWRGRPVYYTHAARLEIDGAEVAASTLRRWSGPLEAKPLWFTVEGASPYLELRTLEELEQFGFREIYQADWPRQWAVPGSVVAAAAERRRQVARLPPATFGTQRYHVRVELYGPESALRPRSRFRSAGAEALPQEAASFPTVVSHLEGALAVPSRLYGLSQIEPGRAADAAVRARLVEWTRREVAFSRASLLREYLDALDSDWPELEWEWAEPGVAPWGAAGDLVRVGARVVVVYRDEGISGVLDEGDLAFDYDRGAHRLRLGDVFLGDGLVERVRVAALEAPRRRDPGDGEGS